MASYNELNALIDAYINRNGVQAITGQILNGVLKAMVEQLGRGYTIMGAAIPTTDPGTPDGPECYFASTPGTYTDFDGLQVVPGELALLCYTPTDGWTKATIYEGFQEVQATIDGNVGTPSVGVSYANGVLSFDFHNMKGNPGQNGQDGQDGAAAGFGTIGADITGGVGTPGVTVESSGPATAKNLQFHFTNLKGETGVTSVVATVDNTTGTPACTVSLVGQQLTLAFTGLKGAQGNTGSSVDYPFTIVNNLTTDDATQALSAAQGKVLDGKVSQLQQEVTADISQLEAKVDDLSTGKYYGYFAKEEDLPEADVDGFAYVGEGPTYTIYNLRGGVWTSSDITVNQSPIGNDEDIDQNEDGKLQFANRVYNAQQPNGMGYKILRKDKTFASQVTDTNTIYEIRYPFSISENFVMPENCELRFNGGSISGGENTLNLRNTLFSGDINLESVSLAGTLANDFVSPSWFGAKSDGVTDCTTAIQSAIDCAQYYVLNKKLCFEGGRYLITSPLVIRRRMEIDGMRAILTTSNNSLSCFFLVDTGATLSGSNITIKNIVFSSPVGCVAYGIKFYNAMVLYNHLENLYFSGLSNACILLESTQGQGYGGIGVYAHGIEWNGIYSYGCSSLVRIIRYGNQNYIYGGQINDIHFEGNHAGDDNEFIMDLSGFRNVEINNSIIEGVTSGTQKAGIVKLTESCSFKNFYVEFGSGSVVPAHTFYFNMRTNSLVNILGYYGALVAPFYLVNCDVFFETAAGANINSFNTFGRDNIIDPSSTSWKFTISNVSLGTTASVSGNNRRFVPGIKYAGQIWIDSTTSMIVDDSEPIFRADLSQLTLGSVSASLYKDGLFVWVKTPGKQTISFADDPIFGKIAIVESTADDNFLQAGIYFNSLKFLQYFGETPDTGCTLVATIVPLVTPAAGDVESDGVVTPGQSDNKYYAQTTFCIGSKLKQQDIPHTFLVLKGQMSGGTYSLIRFDSPITGEVVSVPQKYAILEIAVFKGMRFGNCKAKIFLP